MVDVVRTVLWRELEDPGSHWCELAREGNGWRLTGAVLTAFDGEPAQVHYSVAVDEAWATREVQVGVRAGASGTERRLRLTADAEQRWQVHRDPPLPPDVVPYDTVAWRGQVDVDLSLSPATNTLPIRRLAPAIGASFDIAPVWVSFPDLSIELLPQRYTRLDERRYRFESNGGAFVAEIAVDDLGLVVSYEGLWERIAQATGRG